MKSGKLQIHNLPINDVTTLGAFAFELQQEVEARGEVLPPAARLHVDYLATGNQLIKTITYVLDSSYTNIRYVEAEVGEGNSAERRYWLYAFDIITGFSGQPWNLGKSEEQRPVRSASPVPAIYCCLVGRAGREKNMMLSTPSAEDRSTCHLFSCTLYKLRGESKDMIHDIGSEMYNDDYPTTTSNF